MKIITMCGSYRFIDKMKSIALKLELQGNCVFVPIDLIESVDKYTDNDFKILGEMHKEKIRISDAIYVVDIDNYIGSSTRDEIDFAKSLNKEIIYYSKESMYE